MFGCALLHLWQRNSIESRLLPSFIMAFPFLFTSSMTSTESRKKAVLNEFQCFLFLRWTELKSWLITWRWSCLIEGACKIKHVNFPFEVSLQNLILKIIQSTQCTCWWMQSWDNCHLSIALGLSPTSTIASRIGGLERDKFGCSRYHYETSYSEAEDFISVMKARGNNTHLTYLHWHFV